MAAQAQALPYEEDDRCYEATAARHLDLLTPEIATFANAIASEPGALPRRADDEGAAPVDDLAGGVGRSGDRPDQGGGDERPAANGLTYDFIRTLER